MKLDLIYVEGEHDEVPGIARSLHTTEASAEKETKELLDSKAHVYRQTVSVEVKDVFSYLEIEAALCVWEHINEVTLDTHPDTIWKEYREKFGSAQLRYESVAIGQWVLKVYDLMPEWWREMGSYDWELVPAIVGEYDPNQLFPDPQLTATKLMTNEYSKKEYARSAEFALKHHYGLDFEGAGITTDDFLERWFDPTVDPTQAAHNYATKYDLEKIR